MKFSLCLLLSLFSLQAWSATAEMPVPPGEANPSILAEKLPTPYQLSEVDLIRSFEKVDDLYIVRFWDASKEHYLTVGDAQVPCMENSFKAQRPVTFNVDEETGLITKCLMFGGTHPGMRGVVQRDRLQL